MCVIVDNSVRDEVFGSDRTAAGQYFFHWLNTTGRLVLGGRLKDELMGAGKFQAWLKEAQLAGRVYEAPPRDVQAAELELSGLTSLKSNDHHVLALAKLSGAHLLYSNDGNLNKDFRNRSVLGRGIPRKVYTTSKYRDVRPVHRQLLRSAEICTKCM